MEKKPSNQMMIKWAYIEPHFVNGWFKLIKSYGIIVLMNQFVINCKAFVNIQRIAWFDCDERPTIFFGEN